MRFVRATFIIALGVVIGLLVVTLLLPALRKTRDVNINAYEVLQSQCVDCQQAKRVANQYFNRNSFRLVEWGLPGESAFSEELNSILAQRFGIQILSGGCVATHPIDCYNQQMRALLEAKFGRESLEQAYQEAKEKYKVKMEKGGY